MSSCVCVCACVCVCVCVLKRERKINENSTKRVKGCLRERKLEERKRECERGNRLDNKRAR